jgi:hypothetical protein
VFRLGWLAVERSVQGSGLGGELLPAAGTTALSVAIEVGGVALAKASQPEGGARRLERRTPPNRDQVFPTEADVLRRSRNGADAGCARGAYPQRRRPFQGAGVDLGWN